MTQQKCSDSGSLAYYINISYHPVLWCSQEPKTQQGPFTLTRKQGKIIVYNKKNGEREIVGGSEQATGQEQMDEGRLVMAQCFKMLLIYSWVCVSDYFNRYYFEWW